MSFKDIMYLAIAVSLAFMVGFIATQPARDKAANEERIIRLDKCYTDSSWDYIKAWNNTCRAMGELDNCSLSNQQTDNLQDYLEERHFQCQQLYK